MDTTIPQITITSPTGDQVPVQLFPLPAPKGARVKVWEFFETEPETETNAVPSLGIYPVQLSLVLMGIETNEELDWDNASFDDALKTHLGGSVSYKKKTWLGCKTAKKLLQDGKVEWDPNAPESEPENGNNEKDEDEDEPPKKKRRV
ncbi:hypothetical protein FCULG_00012146 [Fusarium culmorum]|uniref:Uncharacterized protein n=1 Tax=Fusarium culmorum TaxID=5516 RepID=A0A2T4GFD1_FUSCU|nr:hypothetical protein FCULG_00012146 [Fusarium culmorum]